MGRQILGFWPATTGPEDVERHRLNAALDQAQTAERLPLQIVGSAGDVENRADLPWLEARDQSAGLFRRDSDKVNVSARSLLHHLRRDRQRAVGPGADDQAGSAPGDLLVGRERSVSELVAVWLRGLLSPLAHSTSVDDDVVLIRSSLDLDRPESEKSHIHYVPPYPSTARAKGKPQLLNDNVAAEGRPCPNTPHRKVFACSSACRVKRYQQTVEQSVTACERCGQWAAAMGLLQSERPGILKALHEMPSPSSDWTHANPTLDGWLG